MFAGHRFREDRVLQACRALSWKVCRHSPINRSILIRPRKRLQRTWIVFGARCVGAIL